MMMVGRGERLDRMSKHRTFDLLRRTMRCGCKKKRNLLANMRMRGFGHTIRVTLQLG